MDLRILTSFFGGLITIFALGAGIAKPWRGLFLLGALGAAYGVLGFIPQLEVLYFALTIALGAVLLATLDKLGRSWRRKHQEAIVAGEQLLLGSLTAFILAGIFLSPLWGITLGGAVGGLGAAYLHRQGNFTTAAWGLLPFVIRGIALLLPAILLNGRILTLF